MTVSIGSSLASSRWAGYAAWAQSTRNRPSRGTGTDPVDAASSPSATVEPVPPVPDPRRGRFVDIRV